MLPEATFPAAPVRPNSLLSELSGGAQVQAQAGAGVEVKAVPRLAPVAGADETRPDEVPDQEGPTAEAVGAGEAGAGLASAGDGALPEGEEEARRPEKVRGPCAPTRAQWEEQQAPHLPCP